MKSMKRVRNRVTGDKFYIFSVVILIFAIMLAVTCLMGCIKEKASQSPTPVPTTAITPPHWITPIPPEDTIDRFVRYYNERNSTNLYSLFSEKVKANYTVKDVEEHLEMAKALGVKIVRWKKVDEIISPPYRFLKVNITLQWNENVSSMIIEFPMIFKDGRFLINKWIFKQLELNITSKY